MYDKENIFAKIIRKEAACDLVYEDEFVMAFHDANPVAPLHILVIPKGEFVTFSDLITNAKPFFVNGFFYSLQKVIELLRLGDFGYRMICNNGKDAMQTVYHLHIHITSKKPQIM